LSKRWGNYSKWLSTIARCGVDEMPTVSVIVPAFNRTAFLKLAIDSVFAQTFGDWELVVADDGSEADTQRYLRSIEGPSRRIVWLPHSGNPSLTRNAASAKAVGQYLAFLDSDDVWEPTKLQRQVEALRARSHARWSYTACRHINAAGELLPRKAKKPVPMPDGLIFQQLLTLEIGIAMPTVMAERSLFIEIGGFDPEQRFGEFHDLCLRFARRAEVVAVREPLCAVRVHDQHYSSDKIADRLGWLQLYTKMRSVAEDAQTRRHCDRMRAIAALDLARVYADSGRYGDSYRTLRRAVGFSWRFPVWWWGVLKRILRPVVPRTFTAWRNGSES
jgi:glycosyltransferase involved in cell wall biosynthesis